MVANTGTYLDSPFHRFPEGKDLSQLDLSSLADLEGVVVRKEGGREIARDDVESLAVSGKAVLIDTGWSRHWRTEEYFTGHPFLTREGAQYLADAGATLV